MLKTMLGLSLVPILALSPHLPAADASAFEVQSGPKAVGFLLMGKAEIRDFYFEGQWNLTSAAGVEFYSPSGSDAHSVVVTAHDGADGPWPRE